MYQIAQILGQIYTKLQFFERICAILAQILENFEK